MKNIVLYAPPAAGKGTQCELLEKKYGYKVLSIGQILRNQRNPETEIGKVIIDTIDKGMLAPNNIVIEALKLELSKYKNIPIVLDGYPRNIEQAKILDDIFDNYLFINLSLDRDIAKKRTLGRVNCTKCNMIYNIYFDELKPKIENICDVCGSKLSIRDDDNEYGFNNRYDIYERNSIDIINYFQNKGNYVKISCDKSREEIFSDIEKVIKGI